MTTSTVRIDIIYKYKFVYYDQIKYCHCHYISLQGHMTYQIDQQALYVLFPTINQS